MPDPGNEIAELVSPTSSISDGRLVLSDFPDADLWTEAPQLRESHPVQVRLNQMYNYIGCRHNYPMRFALRDLLFDKGGEDSPTGGRGWERGLVFVIMPFQADPEMSASYDAVKRACSKLHLRAKRADEVVGSGRVIDDIVQLILESEFIVCDLTLERPNVYYELGYAHGVGNRPLDIMLIAKQGTALHFDIAPLRVRYYRDPQHLEMLAESDLSAMITETRGTCSPKTPIGSNKINFNSRI